MRYTKKLLSENISYTGTNIGKVPLLKIGGIMTKALQFIITTLIKSLNNVQSDNIPSGGVLIPVDELYALKQAYTDHRANMTITSERIEFLEECLETGMSKRAAARELTEHDPRVGSKTAENLVYSNFSGQYQTTLKGRRKSKPTKEPVKAKVAVLDVSDDESIL